MSWVAVAIGGSALLGYMSSQDAASAQKGAASQSAAAQERQFNKQIELQEPFRQAGIGGLNRLNYLLGLSRGGITQDQARAELLPKFTTTTQRTELDPTLANWLSPDNPLAQVTRDTSTVDEAGLKAAIEQRMAQQPVQDGEYGSLMRDFSMADYQADPGYAFRLSEGQKAIDRSAAARGGLQSGAALKAAARYGQDLGSQEYQNAFNRYQVNRANKLQPLQSLAGMGQSSANTLTGAAGGLGQGLAQSYTDAGNASASGYIGGSNAIAGGLGSYLNYQQGQNYLNTLKRPSTYGPN